MSGDDDNLFRRALADAEPLKRRRPQPAKPAPAGRPAKARAKKKPPVSFVPRVAPRMPTPREIAASDYADMDRRTADRFRRGKFPIDARLDLHGHFQDEAQTVLTQFVTESATQGRRMLLVITGRGSRKGTGVLRSRLPQWLNQPPCRAHVLAFTSARPEHGGDGAFYVLLRRKREAKS